MGVEELAATVIRDTLNTGSGRSLAHRAKPSASASSTPCAMADPPSQQASDRIADCGLRIADCGSGSERLSIDHPC
jgi:hypothetical protein